MGIKCQILPTPSKRGTYRSGQLVTGIVKYIIDTPMRIPYIILFFKGKLKGKNHWSDSKASLKEKEVFVSLHQIILEENHNDIEAGDYESPFEFLLPKALPSTFNDNTCRISYKITAEFMLSGSNGNVKQFKQEVLVYGNVKPSLKEPVTAGITKTPFPRLHPIDLEVEIKEPFLTAGEMIRLNCLIDNEADIPVTGIRIKLIEETTYKYDNKREKVHRKTVDGSVTEARGAKENSEIKMKCIVPTLPKLFSIQNSKYFKRDYKVNVSATFPFPHREASVDIPVVIQARDDINEIEVNSKHNCCISCTCLKVTCL